LFLLWFEIPQSTTNNQQPTTNNQQPTTKWYEIFYKTEFWDNEKDFRRGKKKRIVEDPKHHLSYRINKANEKALVTEHLISKVVKLNNSSRVLDVGAGLGEISGLLKYKYKCNPDIIEPSDFASQRADEIFKLKRIANSIDTLDLENNIIGNYDLIISNFSFDNLSNPLNSLYKIRDLLSNEGIFFLRTRNQYYGDSSNPYHPFLYFPETLSQFINKSGMEIIKIILEPHPSKNILPKDSTYTIFCKKSSIINYEILKFDIPRAVSIAFFEISTSVI